MWSRTGLQRQFRAFETALKDPSPEVRAASAQGVCRVLSIYWELIPQRVVTALLKASWGWGCYRVSVRVGGGVRVSHGRCRVFPPPRHCHTTDGGSSSSSFPPSTPPPQTLIGDLACDKTSALVRLAVVEGAALLVANPLAQPALKTILPHLRSHIHDRSARVRGAMVALLVEVNRVRAIKVFEVCPVPDLLERLALDGGGGKLTRSTLVALAPIYERCGQTRE